MSIFADFWPDDDDNDDNDDTETPDPGQPPLPGTKYLVRISPHFDFLVVGKYRDFQIKPCEKVNLWEKSFSQMEHKAQKKRQSEKILIKNPHNQKTIGNGIADRRGGLGPAVGSTTWIYMTGEL